MRVLLLAFLLVSCSLAPRGQEPPLPMPELPSVGFVVLHPSVAVQETLVCMDTDDARTFSAWVKSLKAFMTERARLLKEQARP